MSNMKNPRICIVCKLPFVPGNTGAELTEAGWICSLCVAKAGRGRKWSSL